MQKWMWINTQHFLITCPTYSTQRDVLFARVETILQKQGLSVTNSVELFLYGHPSLNESDNGLVLFATLEFITKTKRFVK